ncbi:TRAP-type C4-dicarboxylate transport system permease small subunit [Bacillus ectoiniformans]|uniref:TRAP transporter small permease n=1 Tax=Bacillus ectoiniformans TaxID=1494429 RepID=UPI00195DD5F9|nr:TRAP transporter small permease [Bacillus ectoiniformans]MBM7649694.1 TRAP-type C4-dicarboxylate transport system permease small subunit [Bacillus ectoiniformans]
MKDIVKRIDRNFEEYVCISLFSLMVLLVSLQVFSRFIFNLPLEWSEELARFVFIWLVYISISLAAKHNQHLKMEMGQKILSKKLGNKIFYFSDLCWLAFNIYMIFYGASMAREMMGSIQTSAVTRINMGYIYTIIPIGFMLMSIRIIQNMLRRAAGEKIDEETLENVLTLEQPSKLNEYNKHINSALLKEGIQK